MKEKKRGGVAHNGIGERHYAEFFVMGRQFIGLVIWVYSRFELISRQRLYIFPSYFHLVSILYWSYR